MAKHAPNTSIFPFIIYVLLASSLIYLDYSFSYFSKTKNIYNSSILSTKYLISNFVFEPVISIPSSLKSKSQLIEQNKSLKTQLNKEQVAKFIISNNEGFFLKEDSLNNFIENNTSSNKVVFSNLARFNTNDYFCCDSHKMFIKTLSVQNDTLLHSPVINSKGLLGQVISNKNNIQEVMLLSDTRHSIPIFSNNFHCNARGLGRPLAIGCEYSVLIWDNPIEVGQEIYSSGLGGIYPNGVLLGKVKNIVDRGDAQREIIFELTADPLEERLFAIMVKK